MPKFHVWWPEMGQGQEDGRIIEAGSPAEAATVWAEWQDTFKADYAIASETSVPEVCVQAEGSEEVFRFFVIGFTSPTYEARLKTCANIEDKI